MNVLRGRGIAYCDLWWVPYKDLACSLTVKMLENKESLHYGYDWVLVL